MNNKSNETLQADLLLFPPIAWWAYAQHYDVVEIEINAPYERQSYMNRFHIMGPNKIQKLSFPVKKERGQKVADAKLDYRQKFIKLHWRSIQTAYASAPYWDEYSPFIKDLLYSSPKYLKEISWPMLLLFNEMMGLKMELVQTESFTERHNDRKNLNKPTSSIDNLAGFEPVKYYQVFGSVFVPNLSILDLLMNKGPESRQLLSFISRS